MHTKNSRNINEKIKHFFPEKKIH